MPLYHLLKIFNKYRGCAVLLSVEAEAIWNASNCSPGNNWRPTWGSKRHTLEETRRFRPAPSKPDELECYRKLITAMFNAMLNRTTGLDAVSSSGAQQQQYILDAITAFLSERATPRPKFCGHILEDPDEFLKNLERYFNAHVVSKWQRLNTATAALTEDAAAWWKSNQYIAEFYEDFEEILLDNYDSKEVWDQLSAQLGRRNKYTTETMAEFLEKKGVLVRRLKLDEELHLLQMVDMFGPTVLPYLQASQPTPPTHETEKEKVEIPENDAEVNDAREIDREDATVTDEEAESHANSECDESAATAEEVEIPEVDEISEEENKIPANDADVEIDVGRQEILTDEEVEHRTNSEGDEVLEKVEEKIVGEETLESVTEGQDFESLDHAVPVVLGDLHTHTKANSAHEEKCTHKAGRKRLPNKTRRDENEKATPSLTDPGTI
ncbi:hypothetical protein FQA39_LY04606 [Lamprigera yunnana]|nr:hypothetical protein FQA39_LY04606 [Lamprigera yunnana]